MQDLHANAASLDKQWRTAGDHIMMNSSMTFTSEYSSLSLSHTQSEDSASVGTSPCCYCLGSIGMCIAFGVGYMDTWKVAISHIWVVYSTCMDSSNQSYLGCVQYVHG
jgi:hypothetical protein